MELEESLQTQQEMTVCGRRVMAHAETRPGMMGTDDISRQNNSDQRESDDESLNSFIIYRILFLCGCDADEQHLSGTLC